MALSDAIEIAIMEAAMTSEPPSVTSPDWPCRKPPALHPPLRLHAFLYRLLRDGASAPGDVEQIALDVTQHTDAVTFTNPHLDAYARALVTHLLRDAS